MWDGYGTSMKVVEMWLGIRILIKVVQNDSTHSTAWGAP